MDVILILLGMWLLSGILSYYVQRITDGDEFVTMGFFGCLLMGPIGFLLLVAQIFRTWW